ncbi:MAG TPA: rod shape-determining protein MreD [Pantanalinema sp.]
MRILLAVVCLLFSLWLQASPLNHLLSVRLDPVLLVVVAWGVSTGPREGALFGLCAGAAQDLLIGDGLLFALPKLAVGLLAGSLKPILYYRQAFIVLPLVIACTVLQEAMVMLGFALTGRGWLVQHLGAILLPESLGNVVLVWPVYHGLRLALKLTQDRWGMRAESLGG